jgi:hypothetical protein
VEGFDPKRYHPGYVLAAGLADRAARTRVWANEARRTVSLHAVGRRLTHGEFRMLDWMFGRTTNMNRARITGHNFWWPYPNDRAMVPDGNIYFPGEDYRDDFSDPGVDVEKQALFMHEATHLFQYHTLGMWVVTRRLWEGGNYDYVIEPGKPFDQYGIEQMGQIVQDFYLLRHGKRRKKSPYVLADYAGLLPLRP